jgi:hypothetical protein
MSPNLRFKRSPGLVISFFASWSFQNASLAKSRKQLLKESPGHTNSISAFLRPRCYLGDDELTCFKGRRALGTHFLRPGRLKKRLARGRVSDDSKSRLGLINHIPPSGRKKDDLGEVEKAMILGVA